MNKDIKEEEDHTYSDDLKSLKWDDVEIKEKKEKEEKKTIDKYHRGYVEYRLPWLLIIKIIDYLWKSSKRCNCLSYFGSEEEMSNKCTDHAIKKQYRLSSARWRHSLSLICKQMFNHVANNLIDRFNDNRFKKKEVHHLEDWNHIGEEWCLIKQCNRILINNATIIQDTQKSKEFFGGVKRLDLDPIGVGWKEELVLHLIPKLFCNITHLTFKTQQSEDYYRIFQVSPPSDIGDTEDTRILLCSLPTLLYIDFGDYFLTETMFNSIQSPLHTLLIQSDGIWTQLIKQGTPFKQSLRRLKLNLFQYGVYKSFDLIMSECEQYHLTHLDIFLNSDIPTNTAIKLYPLITHINFPIGFSVCFFKAFPNLRSITFDTWSVDGLNNTHCLSDNLHLLPPSLKLIKFHKLLVQIDNRCLLQSHSIRLFEQLKLFNFIPRYSYKGYTKFIKDLKN